VQRAQAVGGREPEVIAQMKRHAAEVRTLLSGAGPVSGSARVLEVGCGGRGLIFYFDSHGQRVGVDPLAHAYRTLFPLWQRRAATCAASGEALPFGNGSFDVVLCENVIDHAERPEEIVREAVRVLRPHGLLYFAVNVHHPVYAIAARLHATWNAVGLRLEIGPFADHTVHLRLGDVRRLLGSLPLCIVTERDGVARARALARSGAPRHFGDRLKRLFFKNARYEVVAVRDGL
jgi:SAM-dependent methyltransferase